MDPEQRARAIAKTKRMKELAAKRRPIWKASDVDESKQYVILLLESAEGIRDYELRELDKKEDIVYDRKVFQKTKVVSNSLLKDRDLERISKNVELEDGEKFYVDNHGIWISAEENKKFFGGSD